MTLHKEGFSILIGQAIVSIAIVLILNNSEVPQWVFCSVASVLSIFFFLVAQFFRVPSRKITTDPFSIVCPSDGKVVVIEKVFESEYFKEERIQVSIFMSPLNVHVQWAPFAGVVTYAMYHTGKYLVAWHPKSSTENERTTLVIEGEKGEILFRQIAGAVARRIKYYIQPGDKVAAGAQVGFIKFGSRVDVFLPLDADIHVNINEKVTGSETLLATLKG
jgi:phosphatidylserine decarboxylase